MKLPAANRPAASPQRVARTLKAAGLSLRLARAAELAAATALAGAMTVVTAQLILLAVAAAGQWRAWALLVIPAAAATGLVTGAMRRYGMVRAATWLDQQLRLPQSLATAAELIEADQCGQPAAIFALDQADQQLQSAAGRRLSPWVQSRRLVGKVVLACLLALSLSALPGPAPPGADARPAGLADQGPPDAATPVENLIHWAGHVGDANELLGQQLQAVAEELSGDGADGQGHVSLEDLLAELERLGDEGVPAAAQARLALLAAIQPQAGEAGQPATAAGSLTGSEPIDEERWVSLWAPDHPGDLDGRPPAPPALAGTRHDDSPDQAWARARIRAEQAAGRGRIPLRYRQLVRDYFEHR